MGALLAELCRLLVNAAQFQLNFPFEVEFDVTNLRGQRPPDHRQMRAEQTCADLDYVDKVDQVLEKSDDTSLVLIGPRKSANRNNFVLAEKT